MMLKRILAMLTFAFFAFSAHAEQMRVHSPDDGFLNVRSGKGTEFSVVARLSHGERVTILNRFTNGWVEIFYDDAHYGYVNPKFLRRTVENANERYVISPDGVLNIRSGPGARFDFVRELHNADLVRILERKGGWVRVRARNGDIGWVNEKYLI